MNLTIFELINGLFSISFAIISIIVGLKIGLKYFKYKKRAFLLVGVTWMGLASIVYASSVSTIVILTTRDSISDTLYMLIGNVFLPIIAFLWMIAFTDLIFKKKQKIILCFIGIYSMLFELYFIFWLINDPSQIGEVIGPVDAKYNFIVNIFYLSLIILFLVTGTVIGRSSLKSNDYEINIKGKLLIIATYSFTIGAIFEVFSHLSIIILIVGRLVLIFSAISFYGGWLLPNWIKQLLHQNQKTEFKQEK